MASAALVYLGGAATLALTGLLVWLVITEIGRAQHRAGIDVTGHVTLHEVLMAKIGIGLEDPTDSPARAFRRAANAPLSALGGVLKGII